jgi:hypothetical protein
MLMLDGYLNTEATENLPGTKIGCPLTWIYGQKKLVEVLESALDGCAVDCSTLCTLCSIFSFSVDSGH